MQEKIERAQRFLERARNSRGVHRLSPIHGILVMCKYSTREENYEALGVDLEELGHLYFLCLKEEAIDKLQIARSSKGEKRYDAAWDCHYVFKTEEMTRQRGWGIFFPNRKETVRYSDVGTSREEIRWLTDPDHLYEESPRVKSQDAYNDKETS